MSTISWIVRRLPLRTIVLLDLVGLIGMKPSCCCAAATPTLNVDAPTSIRPISKQTRSPLERRMALLLPLADDGSPRRPQSAPCHGPEETWAGGAASDRRTDCPASHLPHGATLLRSRTVYLG